jgi:hypothetical protein
VHGEDRVRHHRDDDDASDRRQEAEHEEQASVSAIPFTHAIRPGER